MCSALTSSISITLELTRNAAARISSYIYRVRSTGVTTPLRDSNAHQGVRTPGLENS